MNAEDWKYIADNWSSADPLVQEKIAAIKAEDDIQRTNLNAEIEKLKNRTEELERDKTNLADTNMSLFLRLTEGNPGDGGAQNSNYTPPKTTDYDRFYKD